jgi:hypothetical protein
MAVIVLISWALAIPAIWVIFLSFFPADTSLRLVVVIRIVAAVKLRVTRSEIAFNLGARDSAAKANSEKCKKEESSLEKHCRQIVEMV